MNLAARSYAWAGTVAVVGIAGQWHAALWPDTWLLVAVPWLVLLGREWTATRRPGLTLERRCRDPLRLGRRERGELMVHNASDRTQTIELEMPEPTGFAALDERRSLTVAPRQTRTSAFPIEPRQLGAVQWPSVHAQILGPARLAWWRHRPSAEMTATVVPDTLADRVTRGGVGRSGQRASREQGAGVELDGLRDYIPGDPLRSIDWKATARRGKPVVKLFSQDQQLDLVVALDAGRRSQLAAGSLTRFGHYVNVAAQLVERSARNGDRAAALVFADGILAELAPSHGTGHVLRLRSLLGATQPIARESNPLVAALGVRRLLGQRGLVVFLTDLEEREAAGQLAQATRLLAPKHLPLIGTLEDPEESVLLHEPPTTWMAPYRRLAALEMARDRRLTGHRLRRYGAHVVAAEPLRLAERLLTTYEQLRLRRAV